MRIEVPVKEKFLPYVLETKKVRVTGEGKAQQRQNERNNRLNGADVISQGLRTGKAYTLSFAELSF